MGVVINVIEDQEPVTINVDEQENIEVQVSTPVGEAPVDGKEYVRKNAGWVENLGSGVIKSVGNTFSQAIDFTHDEKWFNLYEQTAEINITLNSNTKGQGASYRGIIKTNGNNINFPSNWIPVINEYTNDFYIYQLTIIYDGISYQYYFYKILSFPKIVSFSDLDEFNVNIIVNLNGACYGANDGNTPMASSDFQITNFTASGATALSISSIEKVGGGALTGGESQVLVNLNVTGTADGTETFEIQPIDGNSIFNSVDVAMEATETTGTITLNNRIVNILFTDLFTGTTIDTGKWTIVSGNSTLSQNDKLLIDRTVIEILNIDSVATYSNDKLVLNFKITTSITNANDNLFFGLTGYFVAKYAISWNTNDNGNILLNFWQNGATNQANIPLPTAISSGIRLKVKIDSNTDTVKWFAWDGVDTWEQLGNTINAVLNRTLPVGIYLDRGAVNVSDTAEIDDVYLTDNDYPTELPV